MTPLYIGSLKFCSRKCCLVEGQYSYAHTVHTVFCKGAYYGFIQLIFHSHGWVVVCKTSNKEVSDVERKIDFITLFTQHLI